ncbi:MAG TPA: hypothetical protein VG099_24565 [Gemmataceae bacterium]|nr:hypothetical protein [Gemmataceae bacterium]
MRWLLKRWWFWLGSLFMLVAICAGYLLIPIEKSRITQENADKIQLGWSPKQVMSLLGNPLSSGSGFSGLMWTDGDGNWIIVQFDAEHMEHVTEKEFVRTERSLSNRMKSRIERRIKAIWP